MLFALSEYIFQILLESILYKTVVLYVKHTLVFLVKKSTCAINSSKKYLELKS